MDMSKEEIFQQVVEYVASGYIDIHNYRYSEEFNKFFKFFCDDVEKFTEYTFDGRFEKIVFDELNKSVKYRSSYKAFLSAVHSELKKLVVPCIIIIPLNFLDNRQLTENISISENIKLFKTDRRRYGAGSLRKRSNTPLERYFKENIFACLLRDHIVKAKDRNFFNYPLLTILIKNIDEKVVAESGRIVEAVYSIIRLLDFGNDELFKEWGMLFSDFSAPSRTYGVYYNEEGVTSLPKGAEASGYGYSMRFKFSPVLDIQTKNFLNNVALFENLISKFINYCFIDKNIYSEEDLIKFAKWQNSIQLFNTAYEFASIEKYDSSLIILLTMLESLFIKNTGNKKEHLVLALQEFLKNNDKFDDDFIRQNISAVYKIRNKFVHEGKGIENEFVSSKSLNSYQGAVMGMKPFEYLGSVPYNEALIDLEKLFKISKEVIIKYVN